MSFRSGLVALIGRPNVGKSSLLNHLMETRVSITSRRPQTTRHRLLGIKTTPAAQFVYVDTPGMPEDNSAPMQRYLDRVAAGSTEGVDVILFVIEAAGWRPGDERVLTLLRDRSAPVVLVINKIDRLTGRAQLLPLMEQALTHGKFAEIVPVSARTGDNVVELEHTLLKYLPEQPPIYPADQLTDKSEKFHAAELIREQIFNNAGQEVPYAATVSIESFTRIRGALKISATIWVEKDGQKAILIGKAGARLKLIGTRARLAMEKFYGKRTHLKLWIKVRAGWSDDASALRSFGYHDEIS